MVSLDPNLEGNGAEREYRPDPTPGVLGPALSSFLQDW